MNPNKTVSANSKGISINFGDVNKHKFVYYSNNDFVRKIQQKGTVKYQVLENPGFNKVQQILYNQAVHGLKSIPNQVIMEMKPEKIRAIQSIHSKAKAIINEYKQEVASKSIDEFLLKVFPKSKLAKQMVNTKGVDPFIKVTTSLKDLKITSYMLAKRLVQASVLPENFFKLV